MNKSIKIILGLFFILITIWAYLFMIGDRYNSGIVLIGEFILILVLLYVVVKESKKELIKVKQK